MTGAKCDYVGGMQHIDLEPERHSHLYEIKPMSRWWMLGPITLIVICAYANGFFDPVTWALVFVGMLLCAFGILCFPRMWLSRLND